MTMRTTSRQVWPTEKIVHHFPLRCNVVTPKNQLWGELQLVVSIQTRAFNQSRNTESDCEQKQWCREVSRV